MSYIEQRRENWKRMVRALPRCPWLFSVTESAALPPSTHLAFAKGGT
jgi:hypothetical protein